MKRYVENMRELAKIRENKTPQLWDVAENALKTRIEMDVLTHTVMCPTNVSLKGDPRSYAFLYNLSSEVSISSMHNQQSPCNRIYSEKITLALRSQSASIWLPTLVFQHKLLTSLNSAPKNRMIFSHGWAFITVSNSTRSLFCSFLFVVNDRIFLKNRSWWRFFLLRFVSICIVSYSILVNYVSSGNSRDSIPLSLKISAEILVSYTQAD